MRFPSKEIVESIRREYPAGTRVELVQMDDVQAPPAGTKVIPEGRFHCGAGRTGMRTGHPDLDLRRHRNLAGALQAA